MRRLTLTVVLVGCALFGAQLLSPRTQAQAVVAVNELDFSFDPATVTVPVGTAVVWTNVGPTIHTVANADLSWSSPVLQPGDTFSQTFDVPGSYTVICTIHPEMVSTVNVQ